MKISKYIIVSLAIVSMTAVAVSACSTSSSAVDTQTEIESESTTALVATTTQKETQIQAATVESMEQCDEMMYVSADGVNVRTEPSMSSDVVTMLPKATKLQRVGKSSEWSEVLMSDGTKAYIASKYLTSVEPETEAPVGSDVADGSPVSLDASWKYAEYSKIHSGSATMYKATSNRNGIVVCVNAGHGTSGGGSVKTQCHPDGTPKVTGGTTGAGATSAIAVSGGMTFADGTPESTVTLAMAKALKSELLSRGYDVLMIRDGDDVQLDNVARTVIANNMANCHIALHWDSTDSNKGAFFMSVPDGGGYKSMEPVASHWEQHEALGSNLISGLKGAGVKIWSGGSMDMDLTQTSYSSVPSVDIELGDKASDHSSGTIGTLAKGLADGVDSYFGR